VNGNLARYIGISGSVDSGFAGGRVGGSGGSAVFLVGSRTAVSAEATAGFLGIVAVAVEDLPGRG
jgi:hypothetical protein